MILNSMLHTSPAATVLLPLFALAVWAVGQGLAACLRWLRLAASRQR